MICWYTVISLSCKYNYLSSYSLWGSWPFEWDTRKRTNWVGGQYIRKVQGMQHVLETLLTLIIKSTHITFISSWNVWSHQLAVILTGSKKCGTRRTWSLTRITRRPGTRRTAFTTPTPATCSLRTLSHLTIRKKIGYMDRGFVPAALMKVRSLSLIEIMCLTMCSECWMNDKVEEGIRLTSVPGLVVIGQCSNACAQHTGCDFFVFSPRILPSSYAYNDCALFKKGRGDMSSQVGKITGYPGLEDSDCPVIASKISFSLSKYFTVSFCSSWWIWRLYFLLSWQEWEDRAP